MMYLIISYSKPVSWLSSYPKKPSILLFHFAFLLAISRGLNPRRDFSGWSSPTASCRYEARPMRCFHYPPPQYSHRPSPGRSTYRKPWHPSRSALFCPSYPRHRCEHASDPYHPHASFQHQAPTSRQQLRP